MSIDFAVKLLSPRSRCARPGHESGAHDACEVAARAANRWPSSFHDVKQRSSVRSRGALLRPGLSVSSQVPSLSCPPASPRGALAPAAVATAAIPFPDEGWMERRQAALVLSVAPATRDPPVPGRPGPLSALHRGGFRMRTHEAGSRQWDTGACSDCPRHAIRPGGRGPDLPAVRFAPQRGTPLLAPSSGSFLENAPSEPGCGILVLQTRYVVNSKVAT